MPSDLTERLQPWTSPDRLAALLGFRPDDAADTAILVEEVLADPEASARVAGLVSGLRAGVGRFADGGDSVFAGPEGTDHHSRALGHRVQGGLALLALTATAPDVVAFSAGHGIEEEQSWRSLSDLGQQVWVHRRTYGEFGLHTQGWLTTAWSGALHWVGRLQANLIPMTDDDGGRLPGRWQLSVHIPESGPLTPAAVDESLAGLEELFARHHPGYPAERLHCSSWLLDPTLARELPGSNLAAFQQRWQLTGRSSPGDADALFFTFRTRGDVDLDRLPTDTRLQRLVVGRIRDGSGWVTAEGTAPLPSGGAR
nr:acyltransferase domain-containing protein [Auraticoccus cholistanensis]